jgi:hypothetical protein
MYGRPPFEQIFGSLAQSIEAGQYLPGREATLKTRLGVYFCGVRLSHSTFSPLRFRSAMIKDENTADVSAESAC